MTRQEYLDIYDVVGVALEIYNTFGRGMAEPIYQEAFEMELNLRNMQAEREKELHLKYKGVEMKKTYYADFYYKGIVVELKAVDKILPEHRAQLFNYMRIAGQDRGVLINFGEASLRAERYLFDKVKNRFVLISKDNYKQYID